MIVFNRTSANGIKILQFKENTGKMEALRMEDNQKSKVSLTDLGKHLFGYLCVTSNIPYKEIKYYLYLIQKRKPIKKWKIKGRQLFNWLENNLINFKLDTTAKVITPNDKVIC